LGVEVESESDEVDISGTFAIMQEAFFNTSTASKHFIYSIENHIDVLFLAVTENNVSDVMACETE
jgi:hypothetical protein